MPLPITGSMNEFTALVDIDAGSAVGLDATTGKVIPCDNTAPNPIACIGVSINNSLAGQTVTVQQRDIMTVKNYTGGIIGSGHFVGDGDGTGHLQDAGPAEMPTAGSPSSLAGICLSSTTSTITLLVMPIQFGEITGTGPAIPNFADREIPTGTINSSNQVFTLANTPNPPFSLIFYEVEPSGNTEFWMNDGGTLTGQQHTYSLTGDTATLTPAPTSGGHLFAFYRF